MLSKCPIQVLHDDKNQIGRTVKLSENDSYREYQFDVDSLRGDIVWDWFYENLEGFESVDVRKDEMISLENSIESQGLRYITKNPEDAERVKSFVKSYYSNMDIDFIETVEFEVQFFDSLEDVEYQKLDKMTGKY